MSSLSEIEWGPIDAAAPDAHFREKFVQTTLIRPAISKRYPLVSGAKGSGKTAIQKWLISDDDCHAHKKLISFNNIEFGAVAKNLSHLSSASDISALTLIEHYWQYVILVEAMKVWCLNNTGKAVGKDGTVVFSYLRAQGLLEMSTLEMLLRLINNAWSYVEKLTKPNIGKDYPSLPTNLTPQVIKELTNSPTFDQHFIDVKKSFYSALAASNEMALVVIDEFDDMHAKAGASREQLQLIFDGLVQATYNLKIDEDFDRHIFLKVLVPHDRFLALELRDLDKIRDAHWPIRWDPQTIQDFIFTRARLHTGTKGNNFQSVWAELLPQKIKNEVYGINESTFDYILRHTLYRPRHIQRHLDALKRIAMVRDLNEVGIRQSVRETCKEVAQDFVMEYQIDHPNLKHFLRKFKGTFNVMRFSELTDIIADAIKEYGVTLDISEKVNQLFEIGFFGELKHVDDHTDLDPSLSISFSPIKHNNKRYHFNFYYIEPTENIASSLTMDTLIAIHPIFFDFCDQKPHPEILVA